MVSSFESGILYNFLLNHNKYLLKLNNYVESKKVSIKIPDVLDKFNIIKKSYLYDNDDVFNSSKIFNQIKNIDMIFKILLTIFYFSFLIIFLSV